MKPFYISGEADLDLGEIRLHLNTIPSGPADNILADIASTLLRVAENPYLGQTHSDLTRFAGEEVRSRLCGNYRIYYRLGQPVPEVFAIRHIARNNRAVLANRLH